MIIYGIILIVIGFLMGKFPEKALHLRDKFRITGKRTYTDLALISERIFGIIIVIIGILFLFAP